MTWHDPIKSTTRVLHSAPESTCSDYLPFWKEIRLIPFTIFTSHFVSMIISSWTSWRRRPNCSGRWCFRDARKQGRKWKGNDSGWPECQTPVPPLLIDAPPQHQDREPWGASSNWGLPDREFSGHWRGWGHNRVNHVNHLITLLQHLTTRLPQWLRIFNKDRIQCWALAKPIW